MDLTKEKEMIPEKPGSAELRRPMWKGWALVCGLALAFFLYGLFMFFTVGDKGPPDWDFHAIEDLPGKSVYSTYPEPGAGPSIPDPQHVSEKPALATGPTGGKGK